ncbi:MAG: methyltransferase domain-containing protein, partial [Succinivibrionaceae bacterium]|nr:methyltransferase domain-containing protein [Succinivibrionaceae bacterium]
METGFSAPVRLKVGRLCEDGRGIARLGGLEVYLEGAIDGEEVLASVGEPYARGSRRCPGRVLRILSASPDRERGRARVESQGIYPYGHLTYEGTLRRKRGAIAAALADAGAGGVELPPVVGSDLSGPCRFKSIRHFAAAAGGLVNGFYAPGTHEVVPITSSSLEPAWFCEFANDLCQALHAAGAQAHDERSGEGLLRALLMRDTIRDRLAVLVVAREPGEAVVAAFRDCCAGHGVACAYLCLNRSVGNQVLSGDLTCVGSAPRATLPLCGLEFGVGPLSFAQVNYPITEALYAEAVGFLAGAGAGRALDLCCGVGTITLCLARHFARVTGIEIVGEAVAAARDNAARNQVANVEFCEGDTRRLLARAAAGGEVRAVCCDPSRQGIGAAACRALGALPGPLRLAYIFCSLKALRRDLPELLAQGFTVERVKGFDMFPYSAHV